MLEMSNEQLEEIKLTAFNAGIASNQGHNKASEETLIMFKGLTDLFNNKLENIETLLKLHAENNDKDNQTIIKAQTYTNGNVKGLLAFKSFATGAIGVITILIIPILIFAVQQYMTENSKYRDIAKQVSDISEVLNSATIKQSN